MDSRAEEVGSVKRLFEMVLLAAPLALPVPALAGEYEVRTCGVDPNHSWVAYNSMPSHYAAFEVCGPLAPGSFTGLTAYDKLATAGNIAPGAIAEWRFTTMSGTTVAAIRGSRYLGLMDQDQRAELRLGDGTALESC